MMRLAFEIFHLLGALGSSSKVIILHYCANQPFVLIQILHQEEYISLCTLINYQKNLWPRTEHSLFI